jgi:non-specific serine/threonine protein kinase
MSVPQSEPTFGSLLREHRLAAGLTQEALAERSGVSARGIQLLEAGSVRPRRSTITELTRALSLTGPDREALQRAAMPASRERLTAGAGGARARRNGHEALSVARSLPDHDVPDHGLVALPRPSPTNIPWPVSSLLGREPDLAALHDLIAVDRQRLVTLTGVGGSGKTRLGVQVAADLLGTFADGVWFVELASTSNPEMLPQVAAGALGVREERGAPMLDTLLGFLRRKSVLLLLDNCEHLIDACAALAGRLLTTCPDLHILATSREPLQIHGERRWHVRPLAVPDLTAGSSLDILAGSASVRLFVERAQAIDASFRLTDANSESVAQVCARLDGIPLAIELAASRVDILGVDQIAERLANDVRVLAKGARGGPSRQQTMQAALGWSYDLLTASERAAFTTLSTFAGGFDLEAAEALCPAIGTLEDVDEPDILDLLGRLVDKSLVVADEATHGPRYRLLEPVRQYARQRLEASGEGVAVQARHAAHYAALAERAEPELRGPEQVAWLKRLEREQDNLRAALAWIAQHGAADDGLRLVVALTPYWDARGYLSEGRRWLETMRSRPHAGSAAPGLQMRALLAAGVLAKLQGDLDNAERLLTSALAAARDLADRTNEGETLAWLSSVHWERSATDAAVPFAEEALRLGHETGDEALIAIASHNLGIDLRQQGQALRSVDVLEEGLRLYRHLGNQRHVAMVMTDLGLSLQDAGEHDRAASVFRESLHALRLAGEERYGIVGLLGVGRAYHRLGERGLAVRIVCAAETQRESLGVRNARYSRNVQILFDSLRQQLTPAEFDAASAAGAAMSLDQVLAEIVASQ